MSSSCIITHWKVSSGMLLWSCSSSCKLYVPIGNNRAFMRTVLSDVCVESFSEVLFPQKILLLLLFFVVVVFLFFQSSPHSFLELEFSQCLKMQLQTLQCRRIIKKILRIFTASSVLCSQDLVLRTYLPLKCKLRFVSPPILFVTVLMKINSDPLNWKQMFSTVWLWPCKAESTPCGPLLDPEVVRRVRLVKGQALGSRSCCFSA